MKDEKTRFLEKLSRIEDHSACWPWICLRAFAKTRGCILRTARDLKAESRVGLVRDVRSFR